jgi:hypothetical protein
MTVSQIDRVAAMHVADLRRQASDARLVKGSRGDRTRVRIRIGNAFVRVGLHLLGGTRAIAAPGTGGRIGNGGGGRGAIGPASYST